MFTGIIEKTARVRSVQMHGKCRRVRIEKTRAWRLKNGSSISVDGICSTVVQSASREFEVEYMPETIKKTTAGAFKKGTRVNLELPLRLSERVHGHLVEGHVDGKGLVSGVQREGSSKIITVRVPATLASSIALHGSASINGASLTVARRHGPHITFALIPYTIAHTNLGELTKGDAVNIEIDRLARVARIRSGDTVKHHAKKRIRKKA